jgi:DNA-binding GntR family transcriptional regulator
MKDNLEGLNDSNFSLPDPIWVKVLDFLHGAILRGEIKPGDKLKENLIAAKLGVSRSPVREAIRALATQNLVEAIPQKGSFVKQVTAREMNELTDIMNAFMPLAVKLAASNMADENAREELRQVIHGLEAARKTANSERVVSAIMEFHRFVVLNSKNSLLWKIDKLLAPCMVKAHLVSEDMDKQDVNTIVNGILETAKAILGGKVERAEQLMIKHFVSRQEILARVGERRSKKAVQ